MKEFNVSYSLLIDGEEYPRQLKVSARNKQDAQEQVEHFLKSNLTSQYEVIFTNID
jgi:hypothetical protein